MIKILFVCHGNICRSTMAEFLMRHLVEKEGLSDKILVASAGTSREEIGNDTHYGTRRTLDKHGVPYTPRAARQMTAADGKKFDYLVGMDRYNLRNMGLIAGKAGEGKCFLLRDFTDTPGDVADPWYTGDFETTWQDVLAGCEGLLAFLKERL